VEAGLPEVSIRELTQSEVARVWQIDRSEVVDGIYHLEDGALVLRPEHYDVRGWPPSDVETYTPILLDCFERGGTFYGAFEGGEMVGVAVLDNRFIGKRSDRLQLKFLHVSRAYRGRGIGRTLFERSAAKARGAGARALYISSTPSENTVHFYLNLGCRVAEEVDPDLFALEPEDIHLEYVIP
jgi:predicted N-acetyltransferase YhbS